MLTHPNTSILPGAFVAAETAGASGKDFITGVAAGYEVMERMAADFIPTVMSRGGSWSRPACSGCPAGWWAPSSGGR